MKLLPILAALFPFATLATPLNTTNNPNQPGYVIPGQQRLQQEMRTQQAQQQTQLNQQLQAQSAAQQQKLQQQLDSNARRVQQQQPGATTP